MSPWTTPERFALQETCERFVAKEMTPHLADWEEAGAVPRELHRATAGLGPRRDGGDYVVTGSKTFITSGVRADFVSVAVRTGGPALSKMGLGYTVGRAS